MRTDTFRIGVLVPMQGPGGIFGPSCVAASEQARDELNQHRGVRGRRVELVFVDAGQEPEQVVREISRLVADGGIDALTGWHISSLRKLLVPVLRHRIPYMYTSLSEGDKPAPGVYLLGEDPEQQIFPALKWLRDNLGHRRWHVVGASYVWPVRSLEKTLLAADRLDLRIVGATLVDMGGGGDPVLTKEVAASGCDAVLMLLVGQDAVNFNRNFAAAGLHDHIARYSPLMEENMLLASGYESTANLFCSAAYFRTLTTGPAMDFLSRYLATHGEGAPALNNMAQSCYQGICTLAELADRSRSIDVADLDRAISTMRMEGARGVVTFRNHQAIQPVHLARADGHDFEVLNTLRPVFSSPGG